MRLLSRMSETGRLSHAYLITGPPQSGKRTLALDLARAANCQPAPDLFGDLPPTPCANCVQCNRISRGLHADVRVIDVDTPLDDDRDDGGEEDAGPRRKNISIKHIHTLLRDSALKPFEGTSRVFIIREANLMSSEAANSLLKTLEEPAEGVMIILTAPSAASLPVTIVSRCQPVDLRPVPPAVIEQTLIDRFSAEPESARTLARLARGRPGWAINALSDPTALDRHTQRSLRILSVITGSIEERFRYARDLSSTFGKDREGVLEELEQWLNWWRDVAMSRHGLESQVVNVDWLEALGALGQALDDDAITAGIGAVTRTREALEANANPRLALEVMALDLPAADRSTVPVPSTMSEDAAGLATGE